MHKNNNQDFIQSQVMSWEWDGPLGLNFHASAVTTVSGFHTPGSEHFGGPWGGGGGGGHLAARPPPPPCALVGGPPA